MRRPSPTEIRVARRLLGMTQTELARALGIRRYATISEWENGHGKPEPYLRLALARLLDRPR